MLLCLGCYTTTLKRGIGGIIQVTQATGSHPVVGAAGSLQVSPLMPVYLPPPNGHQLGY